MSCCSELHTAFSLSLAVTMTPGAEKISFYRAARSAEMSGLNDLFFLSLGQCLHLFSVFMILQGLL